MSSLKEPINRKFMRQKQNPQHRTTKTTKPEMQWTGMPAMPTQQYINYDNSKRHPRISSKELELQVTKCDLLVAMYSLY